MMLWLEICLLLTILLRSTKAQGCKEGDVRLVGSNYTVGEVEYCHSISNGETEWIKACGWSWNTRPSVLACRLVIGNTNSNDDIIISFTDGQPHGTSLQFSCAPTDTQLVDCTTTLVSSPCPGVNLTCNGSCSGSSCRCAEGWDGFRCGTAQCESGCVNGACISPEECVCAVGWTGQTCTQFCNPACVNGGTCGAPRGFSECVCIGGWTGETCANATCDPECENGGNCTRPNECSCPEERWTGLTCTEAVCSPICTNGICTQPGQCNCTEGWQGDTCDQAVCDSVCANGGDCTSPGVCDCTSDWEGPSCTQAVCRADFCQNRGTCLYPHTNCTCPQGWEGNQCEIAMCDVGFCLNNGSCSLPNMECDCPEDWEGDRCDLPVCEEGICLNGGSCLTPNTNCSCLSGYTGEYCEIKEFNYVLVILASAPPLLVVLVGIVTCTVIYAAVKNRNRKSINIRKSETNMGVQELSRRICEEVALVGITTETPNASYGVIEKAEIARDVELHDNVAYHSTVAAKRNTTGPAGGANGAQTRNTEPFYEEVLIAERRVVHAAPPDEPQYEDII